MGQLEKKVKKKIRYGRIEKVILNSIFAAGVLGIAVTAPNALRMIPRNITFGGAGSPQTKKRAVTRLAEKGLISFAKTKEGTRILLTEKGEKVLRRIEGKDFAHQKPKRWDKKWRIVIFDVPEYRRYTRDKLRRTLERIGFLRLQNSVWVYPYDCEDLIVMLKADFKIGKNVLYMIVEHLEYDRGVKAHFGLR